MPRGGAFDISMTIQQQQQHHFTFNENRGKKIRCYHITKSFHSSFYLEKWWRSTTFSKQSQVLLGPRCTLDVKDTKNVSPGYSIKDNVFMLNF